MKKIKQQAKHAKDIDDAVMYAVKGERKRISEEVKGMEKKIGRFKDDGLIKSGYNQALLDVLKIL